MRTIKSIKAAAFRFCLTNGTHTRMGNAVVKTQLRAFTLIELLIVVAIIAILAAIAVPNFLEAQTRAKVARVTADMRTMHTAVELYRVDNNKVPIRNGDWQSNPPKPPLPYPDGDTRVFGPSNPDAKVGLRTITTPISYLSSLPIDVFNKPVQQLISDGVPGVSNALDYWDPVQVLAMRKLGKLPAVANAMRAEGFCFLSVGPDQYMGINREEPTYPAEPGNLRLTYKSFYDPTNGTSSAGNVYRFSDGLAQSNL